MKPPGRPARGRVRLNVVGIRGRALAVVAVFSLAILGFATGKGTTEMPGIADASVLAWIYYAASLFVLGGTDIGLPSGEGPLSARIALWTAYLVAPVITTTVVADTLARLLRRDAAVGTPAGHVLLIGSDELAQAYAASVHAVEPEREVVLLTHDDSLLTPHIAEPEPGSRIRAAHGDALNASVAGAVGAGSAYRAVVITADDTLNLECAWTLRALNPTLAVAANVGDLSLLRPVNRVLRAGNPAQGARPPSVFSTHRMAALQLFEQHLEPLFADTAGLDDVVIAGFGRFGQTLLEILLVQGSGDIARLLLVDPDAGRLFRQFRADVEIGELKPQLVEGSLDDPGTWDRPLSELATSSTRAVALLTADAPMNLRVAMLLRQRSANLRIFAVTFRRSQFLQVMGEQIGFELLCLEEMLGSALRDHFEALAAS